MRATLPLMVCLDTAYDGPYRFPVDVAVIGNDTLGRANRDDEHHAPDV